MSKEIVWFRVASVREPADYFATNFSDGIWVWSTSHLCGFAHRAFSSFGVAMS